MKRFLAIVAGALLLSGCAGSIFSGAGSSGAGGGLASSKHAQGFACPDFTAQGALQVTNMTAYCNDSPTLGHSESFVAAGVDPNQALTTAFQAQTANVAQLSGILTNLLPIIAKLAGVAATGGATALVPAAQCPPGMSPVISATGTVCQ